MRTFSGGAGGGGGGRAPLLPILPAIPIGARLAGPIILVLRRLLASGMVQAARAMYNKLPTIIKQAIPPSIVAALFESVVPDFPGIPGGGGGGGSGTTIVGGNVPVPTQVAGVLAGIGGVVTKAWQPHEKSGMFYRVDFPGTRRKARIIILKTDGSIKTYTPPSHIVISRNPGVRELSRAAKRLDKLTRGLVKAPTQTKKAKDVMR